VAAVMSYRYLATAMEFYFDNSRLSGYKKVMKNEARLFKSLGDETRLMILWLLMQKEELCVCDIMGVLGITQSKASRHLRYLFHLGWVTDRRDGLWMYYRISVAPDSQQDKQLRLLKEFFQDNPEAQSLKERLEKRMAAKALAALKAAGSGGELHRSCT
jgi:ArsR family transcriptional regulator, arsenate/arsenite/antimonite-responsive transcriptional repressor